MPSSTAEQVTPRALREPAAFHARALALAENGETAEAAATLRNGLCTTIDPEILNDLAVLEHGCGRTAEAQDLLRGLLRLYPGHAAAAQNLEALESLARKSALEASAAGMVIYPKAYEQFEDCPADLDVSSYLDVYESPEGGLNIFHFGTGGHHHVGLANHRRRHPNLVIALTASPEEHQRYIELCLQDGSLGRNYLVHFGDIYNLRPEYLPPLDVASMPHLGEYYKPSEGHEPGITVDGANTDRSTYAGLDDRSLLELVVDRLKVDGRLLIYTRSHGAGLTGELLRDLTSRGRLSYCRMHESIAVFTKVV